MPRITVLFLATLYEKTRMYKLTLETPGGEASVRSILSRVLEQYPGLREDLGENLELVGEEVQVLVNGRNIEFLEGLETRVRDGDVVVLIPPAAGGLELG